MPIRAVLVAATMLLVGCQAILETVASGVTVESEAFGVVINCDGTGNGAECESVGDVLIERYELADAGVRRLDLDFTECSFRGVGRTNDDLIAAGTFEFEDGGC